jgi:outer membrane lipoprotein-sorting protein
MRKPLILAAALLFAFSLQAAEPTVDEILAKNAAARGGVEKLAAVKSMRITGKLSMGGMDAGFVMAKKRPEMVKMEFTIQGMTGVQSYDGSGGWMVMPFMGKNDPEALSGEMLSDMREQADFDGPFIDSAKKGNKIDLLGKEDVNGKPAYKLKLTTKAGSETTVYVDAATFLEVRMESKRKIQGQDVDSETTLGNYQTVEGLTIPFSVEIKPKGMPASQTITVDKVEINPALEDAAFKMPAAKPAPEAVKQ